MLRPLPIAALLILAAACNNSSTGTTPSDDDPVDPGTAITVTIDNGAPGQTINGFGANTLSLVYGTSDYLGSFRSAAIQAAYTSVGLSLAILNNGLIEAPANAADPFSARANDNNDPNVINAAGFNFGMADATREKIWTLAQPRGLTGPDIGPIVNLQYTLSWLQAIRGSDYSRYLDEIGEHVLAIVQRWSSAYGATPRYVHLFNEPTSGNTELVSSSTQEVVDIVKRAGQRLQSGGFGSVKFVVPNEETPSRSLDVARAILQDPVARPFVGAIGYHPYPYGSAYASTQRILDASGEGSPDASARSQMEQLGALGAQYGVPVWLTEVSEGPGNNDYGFDDIEPLLARAIHVHDNFEFAKASAFFGMNAIWDSRSHDEHFAGRNVPFLSESSSIVLARVTDGAMLISPMGRAIGHYARWLKPGSRWITSAEQDARLIVSAFRNDAGNKIIVVVVNTSNTTKGLRFALTGATAQGTATGEASYGSTRWEAIAPVTPTASDDVRINVRPMSVTTVAIPIG